jgi:geranylgeranyl diphosphate synthase type I
MISNKTAILFQTSCEAGGICAGADENELKALRDFGFNIGMAFQVQDDILDIFADEKTFGKKVGKDIIEKKIGNIVVLLTLEELSDADKKKFTKIFNYSKVTDKHVGKAMKFIQKTSAHEKASKIGKSYIDKALGSLKDLPQNEWNQLLAELAVFIVERNK